MHYLTRYNQMRQRTKALSKAIADILDNWDNNQTVNEIYERAQQMVKWAKPTTQTKLKLLPGAPAPIAPKPKPIQLHLF